MKKDLTLVVLAAGMGSRFGGLKQIEPVGPNGEFIIDYSIKDAIIAGFNKVVFIIKEENYEIFKNTIGKHIEDKIIVEYAFQKNDNVPKSVKIPEERVKPLGTAHALYSVKDLIHENFAIINADDFYGRDGYLEAAKFLNNCAEDEYGMVGYEVEKTMSENGAVKRGIVVLENGYLTSLIESSVEKINDEIIASPLNGDKPFAISPDTPVSMNLFCLTPKIFTYLENSIEEFFKDKDLKEVEWLLPNVVFESAKANSKPIKVLKTKSRHYGITYKEDLDNLKKGINSEIAKGVYNRDLWG